MESPFASWMERFDLEKPGTLERDQEDAESKLVAEAGDEHEIAYLFSLREKNFDVCEINSQSLFNFKKYKLEFSYIKGRNALNLNVEACKSLTFVLFRFL